MIQITPNTYGIIVPIEINKFKIVELHFSGKIVLRSLFDDNSVFMDYELLRDTDFGIIGTVTNEEIKFDVESHIGNKNYVGGKVYKDYLKTNQNGHLTDKNDSYRSLLKSKGIELKETEKLLIIEKNV